MSTHQKIRTAQDLKRAHSLYVVYIPQTLKTFKFIFGGLYLFILSLNLTVMAQDISSPKKETLNPKSLTLKSLLKCARTQNPAWKIAQAQLEDALGQLDFAKNSRFPQLSINGILAPLPRRQLLRYCVDPSARSSEGLSSVIVCPNQEIQDDQRLDQVGGMGIFARTQMTLTQPLYTFGKIQHGMEAAQSGVSAYREGVRIAQRQFDILAFETYYGILLSQSVEKAYKKGQQKLSSLKKKILKDLEQELGNYTSNDKRRVIIQESELMARQLEVRALKEQAFTGVRVSCQLDPKQMIVMDTRRLRPLKVEIKDEQEYWRLALTQRPDLKAAQLALTAREALIDKALSDFFPTIALVGIFTYSVGTSADDHPDPFANDPFNVFGYGAYLGLDWRLNFAKLTSDYRRAKAAKLKSSAELRGLKQKARLELSERYQQVKRYEASLKARKKAMKMGKQWMTSSFMNLSVGLISSSKAIESLTAYYTASLVYDQTIYEYNVALGRLWESVGLDLTQALQTEQ